MAAQEEQLLHALALRIKIAVQETGRCLLTQPADLLPLRSLGAGPLQHFAARHGLTAVPRLGFSQIEFFAVHLPRVSIKPV